MSANRKVTTLRSPSRFSEAEVGATRIGPVLAFFAEGTEGFTSGAAHSPQKSSPGSFETPHRGHKRAIGAAHFAQNLRPSRLSAPHFAQRILIRSARRAAP